MRQKLIPDKKLLMKVNVSRPIRDKKSELQTGRLAVFIFPHNWKGQTGKYFLRKFSSTKPQCYSEAAQFRYVER
jgi:hypothetical protein